MSMPLVTLAQAEAMVAAERERWRAAIAAEIPADMKDWHANSPDEWPEVAVAVLRSRREDAEMAWEMLAEWQARERPGNECKELMRWKSTHAPRLKALEGLWHAAQREANASREAVATLASERASNALLTDEVERLRGDVAAERDRIRALVEAVRDANAAEAHGDYPFRVLTAQQEHAWVALMDALNVRAEPPTVGGRFERVVMRVVPKRGDV